MVVITTMYQRKVSSPSRSENLSVACLGVAAAGLGAGEIRSVHRWVVGRPQPRLDWIRSGSRGVRCGVGRVPVHNG